MTGGPGGIAFEEGARVVWVADAPLHRIQKFATYFRWEDDETDLPMQFQEVNGKGCRIEQHGSSIMLKWDDCAPGKQVGEVRQR